MLTALCLSLLLGGALPPAVSPSKTGSFWSSQTPPAAYFWKAVPTSRQRRLGQPRIRPTKYRVLALDLPALRKFLRAVPSEGNASQLLVLPMPDGSQRQYQVRRTAVMSPELAARYPELNTYAGQDVADPGADLRFELTPSGLRAMVNGYGSVWLIEPYRAGDTAHYIIFDKKALPAGSKVWAEPAPRP